MQKFIFFLVCFNLAACKKQNTQQQIQKSDWTLFTSSNSTISPTYFISALFAEYSGVIWVTSDGLNRYDGTSWYNFNDSNTGITLFGVTGGIKTPSNINWFSSVAGLLKFQSNIWSSYTMSNSSLPSSGVNEITLDPQNNIWLATDEGIVKYDGAKSWIIYTEANTPITCRFTKYIKSTLDGTIWAGTVYNDQVCSNSTGCLARFKNGNWTVFTSLNSNLPEGDISTIEVDKKGNVWLAINDAILKFNGTNFEKFDTSNSILPANNPIFGIAFDSHNNLWAASGNGVFKFDGTNWTNITSGNSKLPNNFVLAIAVDNSDNKWFASQNILCKYTGN